MLRKEARRARDASEMAKINETSGGLGRVQVLALAERTSPFSRSWKGLGKALGGTIARGRGASRGLHVYRYIRPDARWLRMAFLFQTLCGWFCLDFLVDFCFFHLTMSSTRPSPAQLLQALSRIGRNRLRQRYWTLPRKCCGWSASPRTSMSAIFQLLQHSDPASCIQVCRGCIHARVMLHVPMQSKPEFT